MRFLSTDAMLACLPADAVVTDQALAQVGLLFDRGEADRLPALERSGTLRTAQINHEGKPIVVLWYRVELDTLIVDTMTAVNSGRSTQDAWQQIWAGVEMIAHGHGCTKVEGATRRAALARVYMRHGFQPKGVLMRKVLHA